MAGIRSRAMAATLAAGAAGVLGLAGPAGAAVFPANPGSLGPIPDDASDPFCTAANSSKRDVTFTVAGVATGAPTNVKVAFQASHSSVGDLDVKLIAPGGASQTIFSRTGWSSVQPSACNADDSDLDGTYTFFDTAGGHWWPAAAAAGSMAPVAPGNYRSTVPGGATAPDPAPATSITPAFSGLANPNGTWKLQFRDDELQLLEPDGSVTAATLTITGGDTTPPPAPALTGTDPASPANVEHPKVLGSAEAGAQIRIYTNHDCTEPPQFTGTAAQLGSTGIEITVPDDTTTQLTAKAIDTAGNQSNCSGSIEYVEDSTPPTTQIGSGPMNGSTVTGGAATFGFTADEEVERFECKLDAAAFAACASPMAYSGLSAGPHTFSVRAVDLADNLGAAATRSWTVAGGGGGGDGGGGGGGGDDANPPQTKIDKLKVKGRTATLRFSASEPGSTFRCSLDARAYESCRSPAKLKKLSYGTKVFPAHTFLVVAIDVAGNADQTPAKKQIRIKKKRR